MKIWATLSVVTVSNDDVATVAITIKVYIATVVTAAVVVAAADVAAADVAGGFVATAVVAVVTMLTLLLRGTRAVTITVTTPGLVRVFSVGCNDNHYCYYQSCCCCCCNYNCYHQRCRCYYNHCCYRNVAVFIITITAITNVAVVL